MTAHEAAFYLERARATADDAERLARILDAWREYPHSTIAELVPAAVRRADRPPPKDDWLEVAARRDPLDLEWLIANLLVGRVATARTRAEQLVAWPPDPRLAPGILRLVATAKLVGRSSRSFWAVAFRAVHRQLHHGVAPARAALDAIRIDGDFHEYMTIKLRTIDRRMAELGDERPAPPEVAAPSAALAATLGLAEQRAATRSRDDFLAEVYAAPRDDGIREVFADWLTSHDDPRGRFIMLQLTRKRRGLDAAAAREEKALLAAHGRAWLGPLDPAVDKKVFRYEGGFLYACKVNWRALATLPALMTHPAWSTVREYELDAAGEAACDRWLDHMIALGAVRR